jgi:hypothetical protein
MDTTKADILNAPCKTLDCGNVLVLVGGREKYFPTAASVAELTCKICEREHTYTLGDTFEPDGELHPVPLTGPMQ